jgi:hypothetical protein
LIHPHGVGISSPKQHGAKYKILDTCLADVWFVFLPQRKYPWVCFETTKPKGLLDCFKNALSKTTNKQSLLLCEQCRFFADK